LDAATPEDVQTLLCYINTMLAGGVTDENYQYIHNNERNSLESSAEPHIYSLPDIPLRREVRLQRPFNLNSFRNIALDFTEFTY